MSNADEGAHFKEHAHVEHRRSHDPGQNIQARQSLPWVVLIKPKIWECHGLKPWIEAAKKRAIPGTLRRVRLRSRFSSFAAIP
jgi:hypothetical protein